VPGFLSARSPPRRVVAHFAGSRIHLGRSFNFQAAVRRRKHPSLSLPKNRGGDNQKSKKFFRFFSSHEISEPFKGFLPPFVHCDLADAEHFCYHSFALFVQEQGGEQGAVVFAKLFKAVPQVLQK
jgi:hypothetical protein